MVFILMEFPHVLQFYAAIQAVVGYFILRLRQIWEWSLLDICKPETHRLFNSLITNHAIRFSQRYDTFFLNDDLIEVMYAN